MMSVGLLIFGSRHQSLNGGADAIKLNGFNGWKLLFQPSAHAYICRHSYSAGLSAFVAAAGVSRRFSLTSVIWLSPRLVSVSDCVSPSDVHTQELCEPNVCFRLKEMRSSD